MYIENDSAESRLKKTFFVVEATSFEQSILWEKYSEEAAKFDISRVTGNLLCAGTRLSWKQVNPGWLVTVGHIKKRPCCISTSWCNINGKLVMFWYGCSQVTDSVAAEEWIKKHFKGTWDKGTRIACTDAQNFHHCRNAINESNES